MKRLEHKRYKSVITKRIFRSVRKISSAVLVLVCATSIFAIDGTNAGFSDLEESVGNTFSASSLDGRATYIEHFQVEGMNPGQKPDHRITFANEGNLGFRYGVKYRKTAGDNLLCDALLLTAERDGVKVYDKLPLKDFDIKDFASNYFILTPFESDNWDFTAELPTNAGSTLEYLSCQWSFDFTAWQTDSPDVSTGFSDIEAVAPHTIATGEWLTPGDVIINEVMWMGSTVSTADEWIELKNMTAHDIDLSNWDIENGGNGAGHIEIPNGYGIKANGYFLILNDKWDETAVALTADLSHDRGYTHVSGMNLLNSGEILTLENKDDDVIDQTPTGSWPAGTHGTLKQSMERNDIPGDGTLAANWHSCVSGAANGAPYWDAAGNNYGTPLSANLSPIVMNEFVPNPVGEDGADRPDGEWIELYNILDTPIDVSGWYFTDVDDNMIAVTTENTESGETLVPGKGTLVVHLGQAFLDNDADTLSLFAPGALPEDESDDVREDTYSYEDARSLSEGKSFARFPDGEGIWLDPEATPGEENRMNGEEMDAFRLMAFDTCFEGEDLREDNTDDICSPLFLAYIGMLDEMDDTSIRGATLLDVLAALRTIEEKKLSVLLEEAEAMPAEESPSVDDSEEEAVVPPEELAPVESGTPFAEVDGSEEEDPSASSVEETPLDESEEVLVPETPDDPTL